MEHRNVELVPSSPDPGMVTTVMTEVKSGSWAALITLAIVLFALWQVVQQMSQPAALYFQRLADKLQSTAEGVKQVSDGVDDLGGEQKQILQEIREVKAHLDRVERMLGK
ncbi:hypothetical protein [Pseudanabaena sp. FACHB-2040]|uniref:hypothetical protein n=1 Tax=Pseudanabaena sp. FACHB-2040 TaxID=2692859 RepID=UPI001686AC75|nr:hypothetical protein [Pseudanabaena sp. FACHB-2040]MBD2256637.1 hypothetical protein [Pseudanabaena sp. FACHB-2040]